MDMAGIGGGASGRQNIARACAARGLTVNVFGIGDSTNAPDPKAADGLGAEAGEIYYRNFALPSEPFLWRLQSWRHAPRLARALRGVPPPRRLFVAGSPFWMLAARWAWPGCTLAYLYECLLTTCLPHTWDPAAPRGWWSRLDFAGLRRTERVALTRASRCFVATAAGRDEILALAPAARVEMVSYGCRFFERSDEQRRQQRAAVGVGADACVVGLVGYNDRNKAFDHAIRVLPQTDARVVLVICGDGPHRAACEAAARDAGVTARVHFAGWQRDMASWYAAFDVVASLSSYDAYPNVIREGLAVGLPVVVPHHDPPHVFAGVAAAVQESGGGLLFDRTASATGSSATLAACLSRLAADPALRAALGARGQAYAEQHFHWDGLVERLLTLA